MKLCDCGCGKEVKCLSSKFCHGHNSRSKESKEKYRQTCLNKYGVKNLFQLEETKKKIKQTCNEKFGVENPMQSKEIQEKIKQTFLKKYRIEYPLQIKEAKEKFKRTMIKNYGVEHALQSKEIQEKIKYTCLDRYGVEDPNQLKEIKDKIKQTCKENYGVEYYSQTLHGKEASRINCIRMIENQKLNGEPLNVKIGDIERPFLNELQQYTQYKIIRNDPSFRYIIGRFPDGHIPELKLFIQFDERIHFLDTEMIIYKQDDIDCTLQLASLGYIVFRVSLKKWKENKENVINQFKELVSSGDKNE